MNPVIPKKELKTLIKRFFADKERGISIDLFCELAGISYDTFMQSFIYEKVEISERTQFRVSRAYNVWKAGEARVMQNRDRTRFVEYRKEAKPVMARVTKIELIDGKLKVKVGLENKHDYFFLAFSRISFNLLIPSSIFIETSLKVFSF